MQTSSLGVIAASSLSINCQNNLNSERQGSYMGDFADKRKLLYVLNSHVLCD